MPPCCASDSDEEEDEEEGGWYNESDSEDEDDESKDTSKWSSLFHILMALCHVGLLAYETTGDLIDPSCTARAHHMPCRSYRRAIRPVLLSLPEGNYAGARLGGHHAARARLRQLCASFSQCIHIPALDSAQCVVCPAPPHPVRCAGGCNGPLLRLWADALRFLPRAVLAAQVGTQFGRPL
jgi:hypothetical protein